MASSKGFGGCATPYRGWKTIVSVLGFALAGLHGSAGAAGTDKLSLVKLAPNAPGMIRYDTCSRPVYPEQDLRQNHEGTVTLRFLLGADGKVKESLVVRSSGHPSLDEAARVAIAKCSFHPPMAGGKPVDAWIHIEYVWSTR